MRLIDSSRTILASLVAAAALASCGDTSVDSVVVGQMSRYTMQHDRLEREYFVYLPDGYKSGTEYPVVFFLHGYGGSATGTEAETTTIAEERNNGTGCEDQAKPWSSALSEKHGLQYTASCAATNRESIDCLWPDGQHYWPGYPIGHGSYGYCVTELQQEACRTNCYV